jgi:uncharacterized protein YdeI (YjbR/CyaY-like superfamily)
MRKAVKKDVGDTLRITIVYDAKERKTPIHPRFEMALKKNKKTKEVFEKLPPSRQKEIARYLNNLKTEESIERNIARAIKFLQGANANRREWYK